MGKKNRVSDKYIFVDGVSEYMAKRRRKARRQRGGGYIFFLIIFALGAAILMYPIISSILADMKMKSITNNYIQEVSNLDEGVYRKYLQDAVDYNNSLYRSADGKTPLVYSDKPEDIERYNKVLNYSTVMATIEIPAINVNLPIKHGTDVKTLENAVGHLYGSSVPVGGTGTHSVLTAHAGLPNNPLFTNLDQLKIGDVFYIHVMNQTLTYQVDDIRVVLPQDVSSLTIDPKEDYITLVTCTPYGVNSHRLLVRGKHIYPDRMTVDEKSDLNEKAKRRRAFSQIEILEMIAAAAALGLFSIMLILFILSRKNDKKRLARIIRSGYTTIALGRTESKNTDRREDDNYKIMGSDLH